MHDADKGASPPPGGTQRFKDQDVDEGENPTKEEVREQSIELRLFPVGREHRTKKIGQIHSRKAEALRGDADGGFDHSCDESPEEPAIPVHAASELDCERCDRSSSARAALITPRC